MRKEGKIFKVKVRISCEMCASRRDEEGRITFYGECPECGGRGYAVEWMDILVVLRQAAGEEDLEESQT